MACSASYDYGLKKGVLGEESWSSSFDLRMIEIDLESIGQEGSFMDKTYK